MALLMTAYGRTRMEEKLVSLSQEIDSVRREKEIAYTTSGDTWHDNPGFNRLEQIEHQLVNELMRVQSTLSKAMLIDPKPLYAKVEICSFVAYRQQSLIQHLNGDSWCEIVGYGESDFDAHKISYDTPIGRALFGLQVGGQAESRLPRGSVMLEVIGIYKDRRDMERGIVFSSSDSSLSDEKVYENSRDMERVVDGNTLTEGQCENHPVRRWRPPLLVMRGVVGANVVEY